MIKIGIIKIVKDIDLYDVKIGSSVCVIIVLKLVIRVEVQGEIGDVVLSCIKFLYEVINIVSFEFVYRVDFYYVDGINNIKLVLVGVDIG